MWGEGPGRRSMGDGDSIWEAVRLRALDSAERAPSPDGFSIECTPRARGVRSSERGGVGSEVGGWMGGRAGPRPCSCSYLAPPDKLSIAEGGPAGLV